MALAEVANGRELLPDFLSGSCKTAKFGKLEVESGEAGVFHEVKLVFAFVKAGLDIVGEVDEELLGKRAGPGSRGGRRVEGRDNSREGVKEMGWGVQPGTESSHGS